MPDWATKIPTDKQFYFGVGIGESASEAEARALADKDAVAKLFEAVYGVNLTVQAMGESGLESSSISSNWSSEIKDSFLDKVIRVECSAPAKRESGYIDYCLVKIKKSLADAQTKKKVGLAKQSRGFLNIDTVPAGAAFSIDGQRQGLTPNTSSLLPGIYDVIVSLDMYQSVVKKIEIRAGEKVSLHISLQMAFGDLKVSCGIPRCQLYIDREIVSISHEWNFKLPVGKHMIELRSEGYVPFKADLNLDPGETKIFNVVLNKANGETRGRKNELISDAASQAAALMREKDWPKLVKFSREHRLKGWISNSYYFEGVGLMRLGALGDAKSAFLKSISDFDNSSARAGVCNVLSELNSFTEAREECNAGITLDPENHEILLIRAFVSYREYQLHSHQPALKSRVVHDFYLASQYSDRAKDQFQQLCKSLSFAQDEVSDCNGQ